MYSLWNYLILFKEKIAIFINQISLDWFFLHKNFCILQMLVSVYNVEVKGFF